MGTYKLLRRATIIPQFDEKGIHTSKVLVNNENVWIIG